MRGFPSAVISDGCQWSDIELMIPMRGGGETKRAIAFSFERLMFEIAEYSLNNGGQTDVI